MPELEMSSCRAPRKFDGLRHAALRYPSFRERAQNQAGMEHVDLTFSSWSGAVLTNASPGTARSERRSLARSRMPFLPTCTTTDQPQRTRPSAPAPDCPFFASPFISRTRHSFCHVTPALSSAASAEREAAPILRYVRQRD